MAGACATCVVPGGAYATPALATIAEAMAQDDWDAAIEAGLLRWNGCAACAAAQGIDAALAARMREVRDERLAALAARERYRTKQARQQARALQKNPLPPLAPATAGSTRALPPVAALALARAKAKAARSGPA